MIKRLANSECVTALFDGVFAVALTIMVLYLNAPHEAALRVLPVLPAAMFVLVHVMYMVFCAEDVDGLYLREISL
jgi:uncharacterized membrane protein